MRFEKKSDCYLDTETGLEWSLENYDPMTWEHVMTLGYELGDGWRIPSIQELFSIIDYSRFNPATELPNMVSPNYWSSNTFAYGPNRAWGVDFGSGYVGGGSKASGRYVRCVRGGPLEYKT